MPLSDIIAKIEETSLAESRKVLEEAEDRRKKIISSAQAEAESRRERILGEARSGAAKAESLSKARADALRRQLVLKAKQELVDGVFSDALSRLSSMPVEAYRETILGALRGFASGTETVTLGHEDEARLGPGFAEAANAAMVAAGKEGRLNVTFAPASLGGGLILTSGGVSENLTFPTLVGRFRDEMELEVARVLFSS
ncbi:MAG: V-type ATP synthase subunit E [Bacillota bacterium]